jgi:hypothetical protein
LIFFGRYKNITFQRISKMLPSKGYQKLYLPKDIKNFTFQRISKTLPSKGYQKLYVPKDIKNITRKIKIRLLWLEWVPFCPLQGK